MPIAGVNNRDQVFSVEYPPHFSSSQQPVIRDGKTGETTAVCDGQRYGQQRNTEEPTQYSSFDRFWNHSRPYCSFPYQFSVSTEGARLTHLPGRKLDTGCNCTVAITAPVRASHFVRCSLRHQRVFPAQPWAMGKIRVVCMQLAAVLDGENGEMRV